MKRDVSKRRRPFNPKRDRNHRIFEGAPLCQARGGWALPRHPVTCRECLQVEREAIEIAHAFARVVKEMRGIFDSLGGGRGR